eukprot:2978780-Prymnesium_polylepis.1
MGEAPAGGLQWAEKAEAMWPCTLSARPTRDGHPPLRTGSGDGPAVVRGAPRSSGPPTRAFRCAPPAGCGA